MDFRNNAKVTFTLQTDLLRRIGGSEPKKVVFNILRELIGHDLSLQVRQTSVTGKIAFSTLKIAVCVHGMFTLESAAVIGCGISTFVFTYRSH